MKRFKKYSLIALVCILFILLLFLCVAYPRYQAVQNKGDRNAEIKLRFISNWGKADQRAGTLKEILDQFMEDHKNIKIVNESMFGEDFLSKLKIDFVSGNDPDVFGLWPGSDLRTLVKADKVANLDTILEEDRGWKESFKGNVWAYTTYNNKIYGIPLEIVYQCLFINKDLFEKYKVPIPQNYDELKLAVLTFRKERIIPIAYNSLAEGSFLYQNIIARLGGREGASDPFQNRKVQSYYIDAMNYMKELYQLGAFPWEAFILDNAGMNELFVSKKAAMIVQGSWFINYFSDEDQTVDMIPFPYFEQGKSDPTALIYGLGTGTFHVSKTAWDDQNKREASVKLLKALTSRESALKFTSQADMLTSIDITGCNVQYGPLMRKGQQLLADAKELIEPPDSFVDRSVWEEIIMKQFPYVLEE